MPRRILVLLHLAAPVTDVPENDGLGRAGRLAGSQDFAVRDAATLNLGVDFRVANPLHAVAALLHDAARANGHVGVELLARAFRSKVAVLEKVEAPHLVGTIVRAKTGADAALIDHVIQA